MDAVIQDEKASLTLRKHLAGRYPLLYESSVQVAPGLREPTFIFEVHELRRFIRTGPDGQYIPQVVLGLTQSHPTQVQGSSGLQPFRGG